MPYKTIWVDPKVFFEHKGVTVYHCYKDDEMRHGPLKYTFTTNKDSQIDGTEKDPYVFSVKDLPDWVPCVTPPILRGSNNNIRNKYAWKKWHDEGVENKYIKNFIRGAINKGLIEAPPVPASMSYSKQRMDTLFY